MARKSFSRWKHVKVTEFSVTPWTSGEQNHTTGSGFGIRIPLRMRQDVFRPEWSSVVVQVDGEDVEVDLTPGFWRQCSEIRHRRIGEWLIRHGLDRWPRGRPPRLVLCHMVTGSDERRFLLYPPKEEARPREG